MICAIGLGVLGFAAMRHAGRCHGRGHHGGWRHRHYGRRWMLHLGLSHIDASPAQERAIIAELEKLEERLSVSVSSFRASRRPALTCSPLGDRWGSILRWR